MKKDKNKVLIIIPAYNEEANILNTYNTIVKYNKKHKTNYNVIVINDGSTDNTSKICHENNIPVIDLIRNLGIGGAVQTGYKYALENNYDIAVQYDGDGQHDVNCVKDIINPIINNEASMVIGSRFIKKESSEFQSSMARRIGIKLISFVIKFKTGKKIYDTTSGFRAVNRDVMRIFNNNYPTEYPEPISTVSIINNSLEVLEVPVSMKERVGGESSIKSWKKAYYMINVFMSILIIGKRVK